MHKHIRISLFMIIGMKAWIAEKLLEYSHFVFIHWDVKFLNSVRLSNNFRAAGKNGCLDFSIFCLHFVTRVADHEKCGRGLAVTFVYEKSCLLTVKFSWMGARENRKVFVGVECSHLMTVRRISFSTQPMRRV